MTKLQEWMARHGLTQAEAAQRIGISRSYLSEILGGSKPPGRKAIRKMADASAGEVPVDAWFGVPDANA